jgi:hypothetical protein
VDHTLKDPKTLRDLARELVAPSEAFERYARPRAPGSAPAGLDLLGQLGEVARQSFAPTTTPVNSASAAPAPASATQTAVSPKAPAPPVRYESNRPEYRGALGKNHGLAEALMDFHRRTQPAAHRPRPTLETSPNGELQLPASSATTTTPESPAAPPRRASRRPQTVIPTSADEFQAPPLPEVQAVPKPQGDFRTSGSTVRRRTPVLRPSGRG